MAILDTESQRVILASRSPRRIQLMKKIVNHFETMASDIDERIPPNEPPQSIALILAERKAQEVASRIGEGIVIGGDSIVVVNDEVLGKPNDEDESMEMLKKLSGKKHTVYTGVCVIKKPENQKINDVVATEVIFRELEQWEVHKYIEKCQPFDKAGSYGIQDDAAVFIEEIHGCYYNVVGLPVAKVYEIMKKLLNK